MSGLKKDQEFKRVTFTTKSVDEVTEKLNLGYQIKRENTPWWKNMIGVRKAGLAFAATKEEYEEYLKCKLDIHYFAEKYCKIKLEDGSVGKMYLRDYQKDILDLYNNNRFSILCASRQVGKCYIFDTQLLIYDYLNKQFNLISAGEFYFEQLSKHRKLTFLEKIKKKLMAAYTTLTRSRNTYILHKIKENKCTV